MCVCVCVCVCGSGFSNDSFGGFFLRETKIVSSQQKLRPIDHTSAVKGVANTSVHRGSYKTPNADRFHMNAVLTCRKVKTEVLKCREEMRRL